MFFDAVKPLVCLCRPPRGGRGLKFKDLDKNKLQTGRPPRGGRGLKFPADLAALLGQKSPPSRGAWIEIAISSHVAVPPSRRPPRGGRGLKCENAGRSGGYQLSPPSRGAGIEIAATTPNIP